MTGVSSAHAARQRAAPAPSSRVILKSALIRVAEHWQLSWINAADYKALGVIEGCAHELAHALDLGPAFEALIQNMDGEEANRHETAALRIEVAALASLGVRVSMRRLRASANWNGDVGIPTIGQLRAPLNSHEQHCVNRFMGLVTEEVQNIGSPLSGLGTT